jgi:uncharacterized protein (UPF0276 family)
MMIKLGVAVSKSSVALAKAGRLDVDYIQYYAQLGVQPMHEILPYKAVMLHDLPEPFWLNYENPFQEETMKTARELVDMAKSPWLSTGIGASAEPQAHRDGPYREADPEDLQSRETVIANITKHGRRLVEWLGETPLLLENFNYHPTNAYEYICEPDLFSSLLDDIGCGMLLDLAHARISAHNMGWKDAETYLSALPLNKVREIHTNRPGWEGDQRVDLHQPLQQDDLPILGWVLDHTPAEAVTIEVATMDEPTVLAQVEMMRKFLNGR